MCREEDFLKLPLNTPPELQRSDLSLSVLQLKALGIDNIVRFEFPSAPPARNLICAMELLFALGGIDEDGELTKPLGEQMAELPISPTISKMLLVSGEQGCSKEIATIVAMLQVENVFVSGRSDKVKVMKRRFEVEQGDFLTLLNVFYAFEKFGMKKNWCNSNALRYKALKRAADLRDQLFKTLRRLEVPLTSTSDEDCVLKCIVSGLFPNAAYLHHSGEYKSIRGDVPLKVHPTSVLFTEKHPPYLVYNEINHTKHVYMRDVTAIDPCWLEVLAPHFYENRRREREIF
ncbi:probable ATP-dependent RNA helicase DHX35 isoform X2 [Eurytemora carolleeae]|nr:probable ATP-dependent RNA helicase DHX35 isoform X2 [Eurytemora carolleeae]|eukprot:XP_023332276.1 probable ATP-dependent RNA helicase DHX35 isoform X2 [Eurytemora affinis]